jgi:hypothetical protein
VILWAERRFEDELWIWLISIGQNLWWTDFGSEGKLDNPRVHWGKTESGGLFPCGNLPDKKRLTLFLPDSEWPSSVILPARSSRWAQENSSLTIARLKNSKSQARFWSWVCCTCYFVHLSVSTAVIDTYQDIYNAKVYLKDGSSISGDLIIGADGERVCLFFWMLGLERPRIF